jgi:long-chain acyl-CoA synthetase
LITDGQSGRDECVLLTGATGFLGQWTLRALLERVPEARVVALVRAGKGETAAERLAKVTRKALGEERAAEALTRFEAIEADLSSPRCGLTEQQFAELAGRVTRIIHCAASVRFDEPLQVARQINVEGTRGVLDLARAARRAGMLRSMAHVGTAFVAGDRAGLARENELETGQGFRNTYEQTKCEAERLVRDAQREFPLVILRPSIVVGDSETGVTTSFKTLYWPLKVYARGLWRTVPGYPDSVIDVVPVDFVAQATVEMTFEPRAFGLALHLCAGPERSATIDEIARAAAATFKVKPPRYVDPKLFFALVHPLLWVLAWGKRRRILENGKVYRPYFAMRTLFDTTVADTLLTERGLTAPPVMKYLERILRYSIETDWGRLPSEPGRKR